MAPHNPPDYSLAGYRAILQQALLQGYLLTDFASFQTPEQQPILLLRHDVDHCVSSAVLLAHLEAELNVRSTYFVQVASPLYNLRSHEVSAQIHQIRALGHEIGLHYDANLYTGPQGQTSLRRDLEMLEECSGGSIISASQHIPIDGESIKLDDQISHEAYQERFTRGQMQYVSDSLMRWRQATPRQLIAQQSSFQWLTHPLQWAHEGLTDMAQALKVACRDHQRQTAAYFETLRIYYEQLLKERAWRDAAFLKQRGWEGTS